MHRSVEGRQIDLVVRPSRGDRTLDDPLRGQALDAALGQVPPPRRTGRLTSNNDCGREVIQGDAYLVEVELVPALRAHEPPPPIGWQATDTAGDGILASYKLVHRKGTYVATNGRRRFVPLQP